MTAADTYPGDRAGRTRWIRASRPDLSRQRRKLRFDRPSHWLLESEPDDLPAPGEAVRQEIPTLTVFLATSECPWTCLMCDLWRHATLDRVPPGSIPSQIGHAMEEGHKAGFPNTGFRQIKLYNPGSFFDAGAVPPSDDDIIANRLKSFDRVVVECHPQLVDFRCEQFGRRLGGTGRLEVALGLETAHPATLERLNKGISVDDFRKACGRLGEWGHRIRAFILIQPPFQSEGEAEEWALRSVEIAVAAGVTTISLLPVRPGNGAMDRLAESLDFRRPSPEMADRVFRTTQQVCSGRARVFMDIWDLPRWCPDESTRTHWQQRWEGMNRIGGIRAEPSHI